MTYALITPDGTLEFKQGIPHQTWRDADPHYGAHSSFTVRPVQGAGHGLRAYVGDVSALDRAMYPPNAAAQEVLSRLAGQAAAPQFGNVVLCGNKAVSPIGETDLCALTEEQQAEITGLHAAAASRIDDAWPGAEDPHAHAGFEISADDDPNTRPGIDYLLLGKLMGAAYDSCTSCQDPLLTLLVESAVTTARLVEVACDVVQGQFGGLPASMTDADVPSQTSLPFKKLATAGLDGNNDQMFALCAELSVVERREAANTALDLLTGLLPG